ncbi:MAG TPA: ShlB/FhaC/HecB family hemolysin secretion/activation protein [Stellaceae bacterium]|nr:ShlB/FhaC/HecB family hemolysin secretion/activation protein [Stellaceae bacterium]
MPPLLPTPAPGAPEVPAGPPVNVAAVDIQGATAYKPGELEPYYHDIVGKSVPLSEVSAVLQQIQTKYRNDGYVLTVVRGTVEPVDGRSTLRIRVIEGFISDVKLDGDIGPVGVLIYNFLNKLTAIRPVNIADIERALLLSQDVPGVSVRAILRPGTGEAGAVELIGQVGRKPFGGFVQYDNRAAPFAGPHELLVGAQANSFTSAGERTEVILYDTPFNEEQMFGQVDLEGFVGSSGLKLRAYGGYGPSEPGGPLGEVGFRSRLTVAGVSASYPIIRTRPISLNVSLAFDVTRAEISETTDQTTGARQQSSLDELRILRLGETLDFQDQTLGLGLVSANTVALTSHQGLSGLGASITNDRGARASFFKATGELTRVQNLFGFSGGLVALKLSGGGQFTDDVLPSNEKYFLGGSKFGRGYFSGEVTGDRAVAGTAELQLNTSTKWPVELGLQPYVFYDKGYAWNLAAGDLNQNIASAGVGVRFSYTQQVSLELEGDRRFIRRPTGAEVSPLSPYAGFVTVIVRF